MREDLSKEIIGATPLVVDFHEHHVVTMTEANPTYYKCTRCGLKAYGGLDIDFYRQNPCNEVIARQVMES